MISIDLVKLHHDFKKIRDIGWIKTLRNGTSGVGYTFESLLHKPEDSSPLPDYGKFEIKTRRAQSKSNISLFSATPDGDFKDPIKKLQKEFGYPHREYPYLRVFNGAANGKYFQNIGSYFQFKLSVDRINKVVRLLAQTNSGRKKDTGISWSVELLEEKLKRKSEYLAIVWAFNKRIKGIEYFKYVNLRCYVLKDFNTFIKLLDNGDISVRFRINIKKRGRHFGKIYDHGTSFEINPKELRKLYQFIA